VSWGFVFSPLVGAIETFAPGRVRAAAPYLGHLACYAAAFAAARQLAQPSDVPDAHADAKASAGAAPAPVLPAAALDVLRQLLAAIHATPGATLRLTLFLILGAIMGTIGSFLFLWLRVLGGSELLDGLALTVTCVSEVAIFYYSGEIQMRLGGVTNCLHLVIFCYASRLICYAALPALGGAWAVLPVQLLHGVTFGLYWSVGNAFARSLAPPGLESSMQALFSGLNSAGACIGNVLAGAIVQRWGFRALWLGWAGGMAAASALLAASAARERSGAGGDADADGGGYARVADEEGEEDAEEAGDAAAELEAEAKQQKEGDAAAAA
jgi:hypothetical protein